MRERVREVLQRLLTWEPTLLHFGLRVQVDGTECDLYIYYWTIKPTLTVITWGILGWVRSSTPASLEYLYR